MSEEQRRTIIDGLQEGLSLRVVAKRAGCSHATVSRVANAEGLARDVSQTKKATQAHRDYAALERLELLNETFDKCRDLMRACDSTKQAQEIVTAIAILIDKRRLEDGEATSRQEIHDGGRREQAVTRLADIVQRRRVGRAAG